MRTKWTIPELVESYTAIGIPKRRAVRYIVECHLSARRAPGKGNKAAKRGARLMEQRLATAWEFEDSFNRRRKCAS